MLLSLDVFLCLFVTYLAALQLMYVGLGVWLPYDAGVFYQGLDTSEICLLLYMHLSMFPLIMCVCGGGGAGLSKGIRQF